MAKYTLRNTFIRSPPYNAYKNPKPKKNLQLQYTLMVNSEKGCCSCMCGEELPHVMCWSWIRAALYWPVIQFRSADDCVRKRSLFFLSYFLALLKTLVVQRRTILSRVRSCIASNAYKNPKPKKKNPTRQNRPSEYVYQGSPPIMLILKILNLNIALR